MTGCGGAVLVGAASSASALEEPTDACNKYAEKQSILVRQLLVMMMAVRSNLPDAVSVDGRSYGRKGSIGRLEREMLLVIQLI